MKLRDLCGQRFGRLLVQQRANKPGRRVVWQCVCDCGAQVSVVADPLLDGRTRSCGCLRDEVTSARTMTHGHTRGARGQTKASREYRSWDHAKSRCFCATDAKYPIYGGRGITMCVRWRDSFETFLADMGPCPAGRTIDRIDNDGNYSCGHCHECRERGWPANCRWATHKEQCRNRRNNTLLTLDGNTQCLAAWAEETGIDSDNLCNRLKLGWSVEEAISLPVRARKPYVRRSSK